MQTSIFELYREAEFIKKAEIECVSDFEEKMKTNEYNIIELLIMKALYKYEFLTMPMIKNVLKLGLKRKIQKPKYNSNIDKLQKDGFIYQADYKSKDGFQGLTVYSLTEEGYKFIKRKYDKKQVTHKFRELNKYSSDEIMKKLPENQWHINLLLHHADKITKETYHGRRRFFLKTYFFESLIEISSEIAGKNFLSNFVGIDYGKTEDQHRDLVAKLKELDQISENNPNKRIYIVVLCRSLEEIQTAYTRLNKDNSVSIDIFYSLERDSAKEDCLRKLYQVYGREGNLTIEHYEFA